MTENRPVSTIYAHRVMRAAGIPLDATISDGDDTIPMRDWLVDNEDDPEVCAGILSLVAVGASVSLGGGAFATVTLTRIS